MTSARTLAAATAALAAMFLPSSVCAEDIKLRIASGHPTPTPYVAGMQSFFVPEVTKRVAARTKHKLEFVEGYGGSMVKVADTLEGVQTGIIDVGGFCTCFEPSNLPLHAFQVVLPFGPMSPKKSVAIAGAVYDSVPYMRQVLDQKFSQRLIGMAGDTGYNILTTFEWNAVSDLKGRKISGAGLNLKWLEFAGATPVQTTAPEVYTSLQTGVYQGILIFPALTIGLKWHEVAKFYTEADFGSITWGVITVNTARWNRLPKEVQDIITEVGREYATHTAAVSEDVYPKQLEQLKSLGVTVKKVPEAVKTDWAKSLANWPQSVASELDGKGLPGSQVLRMVLTEAEKLGHKWPHRYEIKEAAAKK